MIRKRSMYKQLEKDCGTIRKQTHRLVKGNLGIDKIQVGDNHLREVSEDINKIADTLDTYIAEISGVLSRLSVGDLLAESSEKTKFYGDFIPIGTALSRIALSLSGTFIKIGGIMEQINSIGDNSGKVSGIVAENESWIAGEAELLHQKADEVFEETEQNSCGINEISDNMEQMLENAQEGQSDAKKMVEAMEKVNIASGNITEISSIIYAISSKTRLLSLNASIEAAGAGVYGKGFAVVAKEIGELAHRTENAVAQTNELIKESEQKVNECQVLVNQTAERFGSIKNTAATIHEDSKKIVKTTMEQKDKLKEMTDSIAKISSTIQNNAALAHKSADLNIRLKEETNKLKEILAGFIVEPDKRVILDKNIIDKEAKSFMERMQYCLERSEEVNYDRKIDAELEKEKNVECVYIMDEKGKQITHTVMGKYLKADELDGFAPAMPGDNHSEKKYFNEALRRKGELYISHEYISEATGGLCSTYSRMYKSENGKEYILCVDMKYN